MNSILFDIGATKIRMAYSADGEIFEEPVVFQTPQNYEEGLKLFSETAKKLAGDREIKKIAGGMSRSVPGWPNDYGKFKQDLGEKFGAEIFIENDAAIVGLGEANWGAGRGFKIVAYITVSTGVGGAKIVDGKIDEHAIGFEPGKQIIDMNSGKNLEDMISGRALREKTGKHPKEVTEQGVWDTHAWLLAVGLNNIIVEWSPDCVVLGGSMMTGDPAIPIDKTENYLRDILKIFPQLPAIKKAELGDFGGLYGALAYLKNLKQ
jgi:predicted NBD/HSP70 family sugar kinase